MQPLASADFDVKVCMGGEVAVSAAGEGDRIGYQ